MSARRKSTEKKLTTHDMDTPTVVFTAEVNKHEHLFLHASKKRHADAEVARGVYFKHQSTNPRS